MEYTNFYIRNIKRYSSNISEDILKNLHNQTELPVLDPDVKDKIKICTVIGFPNGYNTTNTKVFETKDAVNNGADEIDMVINIGLLKEKK